MTDNPASKRSPLVLLSPGWVRIVFNFVAWTLFGIFMAAQAYYLSFRSGHPLPWGTSLFRELVYAYLWACLTPVVLSLSRKYPVDSQRWHIHFGLHLAGSVLVAVGHKIFFHLITMLVEATPDNPFHFDRITTLMWSYLDYGILLYWFILLLHHALQYYGRFKEREIHASQLETQLTRAQLGALKMQLQPHFLFNTLNAVSVLIPHDPEAARRMISKLADLLRLTLENGAAQEIPLRQELVFLESYLEIEKTRFEDRLSVNINVPADLLDAAVPNLILQPIVENAMRHGVARQRGSARVEISAGRDNGTLRLQVRDNGPGFVNVEACKEGIGFSNTRARLQQLYGSRQSFEMTNAANGGAIATIVIPFSRHNNQSAAN